MHLTLIFLIDKFYGGSRDYTSGLGGTLGGVFVYFFLNNHQEVRHHCVIYITTN